MTVDNKRFEPPVKQRRSKSGFWVLLVALVVIAGWGIQRYLMLPHKVFSPEELIVNNNLQIDLHHPDVLIESHSLSRLPKDLLAIPFLHATLTEDFVFYYQNNADRLGITGSLRRIVYEHELKLRDNLLEMLLDQPASIALWQDKHGKLNHFMAVIKLSGLARLLEPLTRIVADDSQLMVLDFTPLNVAGEPISVYQLRYSGNKTVLFASHGDTLVLFSDSAMLYQQQSESQDATQLVNALLSGNVPWPERFGLLPRDQLSSNTTGPVETAHRILVSANYLGFGYQRMAPALGGVRFEMHPQGWESYLALHGAAVAGNASFDFTPIWNAMPMGASFCMALPVSQDMPEYLLQRVNEISSGDSPIEKPAPLLAITGSSGVCWYPDANLYTPLFVSHLANANIVDEKIDEQLETLFNKTIGAREKQPVQVVSRLHEQGAWWQREVSSVYGQYPLSESQMPESLLASRFFRVSLARHNHILLFSLDDTLVGRALQTLDNNFPPIAESLPAKAVVPVYVAPQALSELFKKEAFSSLPKSLEPIFHNAAQTFLLPKLIALAEQQRYAVVLPADTCIETDWQWIPMNWQGL